MSREGMSIAARRLLVALALLPALVVVIVVLLQAGTLHAPPTVSSVPRSPSRVQLSPEVAHLSRTQARAALERVRRQLGVQTNDRSSALTYGWVGVALVLLIGLALTGIVVRGDTTPAPERGRRRVPEPGRRPAPEPKETAGPPLDGDRDRDLLVDACIAAFDATESRSTRQQLLHALSQAGVDLVDVPPNARFDPDEHRAADTRMTDRRSFDGLVAETERAGFVDRGRRVRWPEVIVYKFSPRERV